MQKNPHKTQKQYKQITEVLWGIVTIFYILKIPTDTRLMARD